MKSNQSPDNIVIVGATSSIAEAMLVELVASGASRAHLIARNADRLEVIRADMEIRFPEALITTEAVDLLDHNAIQDTVSSIPKLFAPELVLIAHGTMPSQESQQSNLAIAEYQMMVTGVSPILWLEAFVSSLPKGTFGIIGSVAGDRGRKANYLYGASKAFIETATQGMQNRFGKDSSKHIILLKPGPTLSKMTSSLDSSRLAKTDLVARQLVAGMIARKDVVYSPRRWRLIMGIIKLIPRKIFNKMNL